ncbi:MAG TPA: hypothetical protein VF292_07390 [Rhodanobacteraceae bacterium]
MDRALSLCAPRVLHVVVDCVYFFRMKHQTYSTNNADECRAYLAAILSNPPVAQRWTVTPAMAGAMLERNVGDEWRNRPLHKAGVMRYQRAMAESAWCYTGETIVFSGDGFLLNGQNRLTACIAARASFPALVAFGVDREAFAYMDCGISRDASDVFAADRVPNYAAVAAASRLIHAYLIDPHWDGANRFGGERARNDELIAFYRKHTDIQNSVGPGRSLNAAGLMRCNWAVFLHYVCARQSRRDADRFFDQLASGIGFTSKSEPAACARKILIDASSDENRGLDAFAGNLAANVVLHWNAFRKHQQFRGVGHAYWRKNDSTQPFPRAV